MKVQFTVPLIHGLDQSVDMDAVPREGDSVNIGGDTYRVYVVEWYPFGEEDSAEPFVHIVIRDR